MRLAWILLMLADPFWQSKPAAQWTDKELESMFAASPWAAGVVTHTQLKGAPVLSAFLASAAPMRMAERERRRRAEPPAVEAKPGDEDEFERFLEENAGKVIVLAVGLPPGTRISEKDIRQIEEKSRLTVSRRRYGVEGHFPPTPWDPCLRLAFARDVRETDRELLFELYLPVIAPLREVRFQVADLKVQGRPDF